MVTIESRRIAVDALGLLAIPIALVAIHFLVPPGVEESLILRPTGVTLLTMFTAAFFHLGVDHLVGNLAGYVIAVGYAYLLALTLGERRWFWGSTITLVLGLPVLVNWTSIQVMNALLGGWAAPIRGFSGIAAGFAGLAFVAVLVYVRDRSDSRSAFFIGLALLLLLLWEILLIYSDTFPVVGTAVTLLGIGLALLDVIGRAYSRGLPRAGHGWLPIVRGVLVVGWMAAVLSFLVAGMFPADLVIGGRFTNIFAHAAGFGYGVVITGWGYRYWQRRPTLRELWRASLQNP